MTDCGGQARVPSVRFTFRSARRTCTRTACVDSSDLVPLRAMGRTDDQSNPNPPGREVVHGDAIAWLREHPAIPDASVIASLPDVSEVGIALDAWRAFFVEAARLSLLATPDDGLTVFFQTDIKIEGRWVSKASMVLRAAEELEVPLLFHKVVCRREAGKIVHGRPGYSHLFAFSRLARDSTDQATPDVLPDLGIMPWSHSMGTRAAETAVAAIRR